MIEKVIKGLECCIKYPNEYGDCLGGGCPYGPRIECHKELLRDSLELLKAQAARVMTEKEIEELQDGTIVWYEQNAGDYRFIRPMIADGRGMIGDATVGIKLKYLEKNSERLWTERPTDAQREETPWMT